MKIVRLSATTEVERNQALSEINAAISRHQGWIVNHTLLSNKAATLIFEMPAAAFGRLAADLTAFGVRVSADSPLPEGGNGDGRGIIAITFLHDEPDLKREVPHFG